MAHSKNDRRLLLIRSGMELISRYGYRDVSVDDITRSCGLSVGSFYKHFRSKESFYDQILTLIEREGIRKAESAVRRLHSPINKLRAIYHFIVLGVQRYPILRGVLLRDPRFLYPGMMTREGGVGSLRGHVEALVAEIIRDGSRRGQFRPGLYHDVNALTLALLDTVVRSIDEPNIRELSQDMLVLLQRGLRRVIRVRRRDERRDRRVIESDDELDWLDS